MLQKLVLALRMLEKQAIQLKRLHMLRSPNYFLCVVYSEKLAEEKQIMWQVFGESHNLGGEDKETNNLTLLNFHVDTDKRRPHVRWYIFKAMTHIKEKEDSIRFLL